MLISEISRAITKPTSASEVARCFAERLMTDPALLRAELYGDGPLTRKRFCELLGIGDSTLTGWLQTERIPQTAAVAYVMFLLSMRLLEAVEDIKADREQPRVVELRDGYAWS